MEDEKLFKEFTTRMFELWKKKNHDYGNSFEKSLYEDGLIATKFKIGDKFNRFKSLIINDAEVEDESMNDTLIDMANYCVMTLMWLSKNNKSYETN